MIQAGILDFAKKRFRAIGDTLDVHHKHLKPPDDRASSGFTFGRLVIDKAKPVTSPF
jgi:hypothetical protein